jgi:hypothetical protein
VRYEGSEAPLVGRAWTQKMLDAVGKGCGWTALAETYARKPSFYGSTYCCGWMGVPVGRYQRARRERMAGFTITQLEAIEAALASGELTVEFDGKKVTYRSMNELRAARDLIRGELIAAGTIVDATPRRSYAAHSRD